MRSVSAALAVLETVARHQPVGVSEVARALELPKSTVQRMLNALGDLGWIRSDHGQSATRWWLTAKARSIGAAHRGDDELRRIARTPMLDVAAATGETIHLSILDGRHVVLVEKIDSVHAVRTFSYLGGRVPLHTVASGKAILAAMNQHDARATLASGPLEALTDRTETDPEAIMREIETVRRRGYAVTVGTRHPEVAAIGAAICRPTEPVAAISISMPAHRLSEDRVADLGELVARAASRCSAELIA